MVEHEGNGRDVAGRQPRSRWEPTVYVQPRVWALPSCLKAPPTGLATAHRRYVAPRQMPPTDLSGKSLARRDGEKNRGRDDGGVRCRANTAPPPAHCRDGGAAQPREPTKKHWPAARIIWTPFVSF